MLHKTRAPRSAPARAGVVVLAAVAAALLWLAFDPLAGMDLEQPAFEAGEQPTALGIDAVLVAALVGGVLGWAALAALERLTLHPARSWTILAIGVLAVSLGGPLSGDGITTGNRLVLVLMHLVVGGILVAGLRREAVSLRSAPDSSNAIVADLRR